MAASNDSVMRFYAVWWARQGPALWRLSRDPAIPRDQLRALCTTTFLGGLARVAAAKQSGRPHPLFQALTIAELALPPALAAAGRRHEQRRDDGRLSPPSSPHHPSASGGTS